MECRRVMLVRSRCHLDWSVRQLLLLLEGGWLVSEARLIKKVDDPPSIPPDNGGK